MTRRSQFVDHVVDLLRPLGDVQAKGMFGGWGLYLDGRMFALIARDTVYIKTDAKNRSHFEERGLSPFRYDARGKENVIAYYEPPSGALDDSTELCGWARLGVEAAMRKPAKPKRVKKG
jgi:DNA transformation protein